MVGDRGLGLEAGIRRQLPCEEDEQSCNMILKQLIISRLHPSQSAFSHRNTYKERS